MTHAEEGPEAAGAPAKGRARGTVERAGGVVVRRVSTYLDIPTFEELKEYCGDQRTHAEVLAEALRWFLKRP